MISIKGSSGGGEIEVVNGIVEKFKAYEDDISPNTFIKFVKQLWIMRVVLTPLYWTTKDYF